MKGGTGLYIHDYSPWDGLIQRTEQEYLKFKRHGKQYTYNNNILTLYQEMANGKEHGITKSFDEQGNLIEETIYEYGVEKSRKKIN
jgi:antitoxin component YwqK of YwqJK toxin-antitoxin module